MESVLAVAAATWGVVMGLSPVLQLRRMYLRQSSQDVSTGYFLVLNVGFGLWIAYGVAADITALIWPNLVALVVSSFTIAYAWHLRPAAAGRPRVVAHAAIRRTP